MKAVYTYFLPEVRKIIYDTQTLIPAEFFSISYKANEASKLFEKIMQPKLNIRGNHLGNLDLDTLHEPLLQRLINCYKDQVPAISDYQWFYPSAGSSEGLFHILVHEKCKGRKKLYILDGEYEGAGAIAENLGFEVVIVDLEKTDLNRLPKELWYISNPSARDGNIISNQIINAIANSGHELILDLAYVGTTKPNIFDISHKQIKHVVLSLSKPFGLFRFRIGCALSRNEIPTLYGNRWFKDITRIIQGVAVLEKLGLEKPWKTYSSLQNKIVNELRQNSGLNITESDAFLIATLNVNETSNEQKSNLLNFQRGNKYRFCLTPFFEYLEVTS